MVLHPLREARRVRRIVGARDTTPSGPSIVALDPAMAARAGRPTLRVAHFSDTYVPRRDGIVTSLQTLTGAMSELGHSSLLVVPRHPDQRHLDQAVDEELLRLWSVPCGVAQFRLAAWPRSRHVECVAHWLPHVVHVHTPGPVGLLGIFAARRLGLPLVQTYHTDLRAYADAYRLPSRILQGVLRCYARRLGSPRPEVPRRLSRSDRRHAVVDAGTGLLLGDADAVLVPTPAILTRCTLPIDDDRLYLAPAGVSIPPVAPDARDAFRRQHGIGPDDHVVLFVGRVNREKGIDLLTEAFGRLVGRARATRLVLVGAVYEPKWVQGLLTDAGIAGCTVLTGQLPPEQVAEAYAAADLFAFPSLTDTQGLVLQEAALAGLPSGLVDPALHASGPLADTGVLADAEPERFAAAMAALLTDPERRHTLGETARRRAEENSPASYATRMTGIYHQAVRRAASATRLSRRPGRFRSRRLIA